MKRECPSCRAKFDLDEKFRNKTVKCGKCDAEFNATEEVSKLEESSGISGSDVELESWTGRARDYTDPELEKRRSGSSEFEISDKVIFDKNNELSLDDYESSRKSKISEIDLKPSALSQSDELLATSTDLVKSGTKNLVIRNEKRVEPVQIQGIAEYEDDDVIINPANDEPRWEIFGSAQGGMGKVYFVHDKEWDLDLAMKSFIPPTTEQIRYRIESAKQKGLKPPTEAQVVEDLSRNFLREWRVWLDLSGHPNVCSGYYTLPLGVTNRFFIEYIEGGDLSAKLKDLFNPENNLSAKDRFAEILDYAIQFCNGMAYIHARGLLHRDIKPDNCLVGIDGTLKVTDFGLITKVGEAAVGIEENLDSLLSSLREVRTDDVAQFDPEVSMVQMTMTMKQGGIGTPPYMPPEQWTGGKEQTKATDIYAFGVMLFEMLTGGMRLFDPSPVMLGLLEEAEWETEEGEISSIALANFLRSFLNGQLAPQFADTFYSNYYKAVHKYLKPITPSGFFKRLEDLFRDEDFIEEIKELEEDYEETGVIAPVLQWVKKTLRLSKIKLEIPTILEKLILKCLDKKQQNRPKNFTQIREWLLKHYEEFTGRKYEREIHKKIEPDPGAVSNRAVSYWTMADYYEQLAVEAEKAAKRENELAKSERNENDKQKFSKSAKSKLQEAKQKKNQSIKLSTRAKEILDKYLEKDPYALYPWISRQIMGMINPYATISELIQPLEIINFYDKEIKSRHAREIENIPDLIKFDKTINSYTLKGHNDSVHSIAFSPDGKILASGSGDKTIKLWDISTGETIKMLTGHSKGVDSVSFSPDGKILASGSYDKTIKLWDVSTGENIRTLTGHSNDVNSVSFSPDGKILASGSEESTIKLWNISTGMNIRTLNVPSNNIDTVSI